MLAEEVVTPPRLRRDAAETPPKETPGWKNDIWEPYERAQHELRELCARARERECKSEREIERGNKERETKAQAKEQWRSLNDRYPEFMRENDEHHIAGLRLAACAAMRTQRLRGAAILAMCQEALDTKRQPTAFRQLASSRE